MSGTIGIFSRNIQESEWTNIKIKRYIDWFLLNQLYYFFQSKVESYFFFVLALNNNNSVIVFYIIPLFTHSSLVLNLSEFLSSAEHKLYFKEGGKANSFWSSVTYTVFFYFYQSQCGPAAVWFSTFFKIPYFVFSTRKKEILVWDNMWVSK